MKKNTRSIIFIGATAVLLAWQITTAHAQTMPPPPSPWVDVVQFGADRTGATDSKPAFDRAIATGKTVIVPGGTYMISSTITLPNAKTQIMGLNFPVLTTASGNTLIEQTHHVYTEISGIRFTGNGMPIKFKVSPTQTMYRDFLIENCQFAQDAGVYAIWAYGTRTGYVNNSLFEGSGNGLYLQAVALPFVNNSTFKGTGGYTATAIFYEGDGTGYSAGIGISNTEILGYDIGVKLNTVDWFNISGSTIDYNNHSVIIEDSISGTISGGNYIGSLGDNPALWIGQSATDKGYHHFSGHILIQGNNFTGHVGSGNAYDNIRITDDSSDIKIIGNVFDNWTRYGLNFDDVTFLHIANNNFTPAPGLGSYSVYNSGSAGDSTVLIVQNDFNERPVDGMTYASLRDNLGFATRNAHLKITDARSTAWVVPHSLSVTPDIVLLTPSENHPVWVTDINDTDFTINTDDYYADFSVFWQAEKLRGD